MAVKINIETLTKQVEEGLKRDELATFYGLSQVQMGKALKQAGLKIRKFHAPAFELVTDEPATDNAVDSSLTTEEVTEGLEAEATTVEKEEEVADGTVEDPNAEEVNTEDVTWTT